MDPHLIDLVWEVHRDVGAKSAIQIVCGYRAPVTNAMLRRRSSGVAQQSQHTVGKAIDFYIPDAKLDDLRAAGLRLQRGGVGFYPSSGSPFVHIDVGSVRHWPRMTHDQLARVFPDGRTVHVPSDGQPLKGLRARARRSRKARRHAVGDLARRRAHGRRRIPRSAPRSPPCSASARRRTATRTRKPTSRRARRRPSPSAIAACACANPPAARISLPGMPGPQAAAQLRNAGARGAARAGRRAGPDAEVEARGARADRVAARFRPRPRSRRVPRKPGSLYSLAGLARNTPNDVINSRGYWKGLPEAPIETSAARRIETASADPQVACRRREKPPSTTGSVGPWTQGNAGRRRNGLRIGLRTAKPIRAPPAQRRSAPSPAMPFRATRRPPPAPPSRSRARRSARPKSRPRLPPPRFRSPAAPPTSPGCAPSSRRRACRLT